MREVDRELERWREGGSERVIENAGDGGTKKERESDGEGKKEGERKREREKPEVNIVTFLPFFCDIK